MRGLCAAAAAVPPFFYNQHAPLFTADGNVSGKVRAESASEQLSVGGCEPANSPLLSRCST